jgi:DNA-binding XRE family transcriptional regulator
MKREWLVPPRPQVKVKSVYRPDPVPLTPHQQAEHARIDEFVKTKPTMEQVKEFFDLADESMPGYVYLQSRSIVNDLRTQRAFQALTVEQLAERSGIDVQTIERMENDESDVPSMATLWQIADALKLDFVIGLAKRPAEAPSKPLRAKPTRKQPR